MTVLPFEPELEAVPDTQAEGRPADKSIESSTPPEIADNALSQVVLRANPTLFLWLFR
ncbi:MAG TPA: hypothetical protein VGC84_05025 [Ilumatobacteraceae bacterium]|jgi:hypothetical protein